MRNVWLILSAISFSTKQNRDVWIAQSHKIEQVGAYTPSISLLLLSLSTMYTVLSNQNLAFSLLFALEIEQIIKLPAANQLGVPNLGKSGEFSMFWLCGNINTIVYMYLLLCFFSPRKSETV